LQLPESSTTVLTSNVATNEPSAISSPSTHPLGDLQPFSSSSSEAAAAAVTTPQSFPSGSSESSTSVPVDRYREGQQPPEWDSLSLNDRLVQFGKLPTAATDSDGNKVLLSTDDLESAIGYALCGKTTLGDSGTFFCSGFYPIPPSFSSPGQELGGFTMTNVVAVGSSRTRRGFLGVVQNDGHPGVSAVVFDPSSGAIKLCGLATLTHRPNDKLKDFEAQSMKKAYEAWVSSQTGVSARDQRREAAEAKKKH
jgi:hypothetical protein